LEETLTEMAIEAMNTKCVCKICTRLRLMLYHETRERVKAQATTISMQSVSLSERASTDLAMKDVPAHAEKKTSESHKVAG